MSNYEFWDELGKIFSAVVAYQEKNIEFNKRFIVPWIRLGNVFDKQDKNDAAISAYQQAIDIDPANAQNWFELGNIHFKIAEPRGCHPCLQQGHRVGSRTSAGRTTTWH